MIESNAQQKTVAIVEDDPDLRANYELALGRAGFKIKAFSDPGSVLAYFEQHLPDLILIDVGLGTDPEAGFSLCQAFRARSSVLPILFLTARDSELDAISGLRLGADDYLSKDISLAHLSARVTALLKRTAARLSPADEANAVIVGELVMDADSLHAEWRGEVINLTVTEFWLVHALARYPGHVKTRQQLMDAARVVLDDQTITAHIKRIRRKFAQMDADFSRIETVYGMGYRWLPVTGTATNT